MKFPWHGKRPRKGELKASLGTKSFRVGGYSVAATALVVVIGGMVNLFVNALPASVTQLDTSKGAMFTISQETKEVLAGLEEDVTVYWLVQNDQEDDTLGTLLDRYDCLLYTSPSPRDTR